MLTYNGKTQSLRAWAAEFEISFSCLRKRLKLGWTMERISQTRPQTDIVLIFRGQTRTMTEWAKMLHMPRETLRTRLFQKRWTLERALVTPRRKQIKEFMIGSEQSKNSREYRAWRNMKTRCYNERYPKYRCYGGRGIKVCDRWLHSFENFYNDMGPAPSKGTLERKDTNGDYTPENCRWALQKEQVRNMRTNHLLTFRGETMCLTAWAEKVGISSKTLISRLKLGWSLERALTETPVRGKNQYSELSPKINQV